MNWIIASLPFWIVGLFMLAVALVGSVSTIRDCQSMENKELSTAVVAAIALYLGAGGFLLIAAKICS